MKKESSMPPRIWLSSCAAWHLPRTAKAFAERGALAGLWISDKNSTQVSGELYRRCWPYHIAMKPFYHLAPQLWTERAFYALSPIWKHWLARQEVPEFEVAQAIMGFATEPFDLAEKRGALKVLDCPNSHPTSYHGFWQRECDLWCPGEKVPIPQWMFARMNREVQQADVILCPSTFVRDSMVFNGVPEEKCFISPFGVDTSVFTPRVSPPVKPRFIVTGTICLRKGFQYLFRAFEIVKKRLPDAELICVGDYKADFRLERPKWEGTFTHHPFLSHQALNDLMKTCTAFVFPSCEEGFARVVPEAMAAGLPIIATHESGATTLVRDGVEGLIITRDPEEIAEAMIKIATQRDLNQKLGEGARLRGAQKNTWQDYGDRLIAEYRSRWQESKGWPPLILKEAEPPC